MSDQRQISGDIPPRPKRPLTNYNIFYILERNYIVQQSQKQSSAAPTSPSDVGHDPYLTTRPHRYHDIVLPSNWYKVRANKVKRSKYKNHGVISFDELTQEIKTRWRTVDDEVKQYCDRIADEELERYKEDVAAFIERYGMAAFQAQKATYSKRPKNKRAKQLTTSNEGGRDELVSEESEDRQRLQYEFGGASQFSGSAASNAMMAPPINQQIGIGAAPSQNNSFRAQPNNSGSTENVLLSGQNPQGLPGYWHDASSLSAGAGAYDAQQYEPLNSSFDCPNNFNSQFAGYETAARRHDPFRAQVTKSEHTENTHSISRDQALPGSLPYANPFTAAASNTWQYDSFAAQPNKNESIQNNTSMNHQDQRFSAYLPYANPQFTADVSNTWQHVPFRAQPNKNESIQDSSLTNNYDQRFDAHMHDANQQLTARQCDSLIAQSNESEAFQNGASTNYQDQKLAAYSHYANQQFTGAVATTQQYDSFAAQANESESIQDSTLTNYEDQRLAAYLKNKYDSFAAQATENKATEYSHLVDRYGQRLSDYSFVDYDSDKILYGEELEKAFDSD